MKQKLFLLLTIVAVIFSACKKAETQKGEQPENDSVAVSAETFNMHHTAQNSLDWDGEYKGIVPCDDCDGVETAVTLNFDSTFVQSQTFIGKGGPYDTRGTFTWDETGNIVILNFDDGSIAKYFVGENKLFLLDEYGNPIEGDEYVLKK